MNIIFLLIGISILIAAIAISAFFWAMRNGQNDDMETPAIRILFDDDKPVSTKAEN
jgi:cbb3-type cytochrome oxidase maturation protein